jgi:hypothetical protein
MLSNWGACAVSVPTISQVTPNSGFLAGGTVFYIGGTNLNSVTSVTVGGVEATILAAHPTVIVATTPASAASGAKTVAVTTSGGVASAINAFSYIAGPTIASVSPNSGSTSGGTTITITGANLTGATSVTVGGAAATNVTVVSATTVTAIAPAGTMGAKPVSVTAPSGTGTLANAFTYTVVKPSWATLVEAAPDPLVVTDASLRAAIDAVLAGTPVNGVQRKSIGCSIKWK